ncbi:MAG: hypothetical protein GY765_41890 [bacterium]|nr:hypothetical protein [bacterium]
MGKYLEIKWQGQAGQGMCTASAILAEILAAEGKYVQAFPQFTPQKRSPVVLAFNRFSDSPIKIHSAVVRAGIVMILDCRQLLNPSVKKNAAENAAYFINTSYNPEFIKEKLNLQDNKVHTLDADTIAREESAVPIPNIALMTALVAATNMIPIENYNKRLKESLSRRLSTEQTTANLAVIQRSLKEWSTYES